MLALVIEIILFAHLVWVGLYVHSRSSYSQSRGVPAARVYCRQ